MWNSCYTEYFYVSNGVKQGSVLSAILFTIYIDRLLILLRDSGVGCKIDNCSQETVKILGVTLDTKMSCRDITLSCPSIRGLNRMLDICNKFAAEHYLIFNSKKSLAIKYGMEVNDTEYVLPRMNSSSLRQEAALIYYHYVNARRYCFSSTCFEHYTVPLQRQQYFNILESHL